jgi:hypothetical protein
LNAGTTKNDEARIIFMPEELFEILRRQRLLRDDVAPDCPHVFFREGKRIRDFKGKK